MYMIGYLSALLSINWSEYEYMTGGYPKAEGDKYLAIAHVKIENYCQGISKLIT